MTERIRPRIIPYPLLVFFLFSVGLGVVAYLYYGSQREQIKQAKHDELSAVSALKVNEISSWRKERLGDATVIVDNPLLSHGVSKWLDNPSNSKLEREILFWMKSLKGHYDYSNILLADNRGAVCLSVMEEGAKVDEILMGYLPQVIESKTPMLSALYKLDDKDGIRISLFAPVRNHHEEDSPVVGVFLLQIDPYKFLYPLIQSWPTPSASSETLLVRRDGEYVLYLNELRHRKGTALSLRLPLETAQSTAAMAVNDKQGVVEGIDYRGVPVLASLRTIPESPWFLIAKVDAEELYASIRERAWLIVLAVAMLITAAGALLALIWSHQRREILEKIRNELERRVGERTAELLKTNELLNVEIAERQRADRELRVYMTRVEESNRMLEEFASIAAHDLQEPLRKIHSFGEHLQSDFGDSLGTEGLDYLGRMIGAAARMQALIQSLLAYSRITTMTKPFTQVDLKQIVQEVINDLEVRIDQTGGLVEVEDLPTVEADPSQMRQLFQNLIANALKFHGMEKPLVKINSPACPGHLCQIRVEDNGIGFDEKYLDRIFAPFQRLHGRSEYEGTGMGLAICKKIVERHAGSITATSAQGQGSAFVVTLPVRRAAVHVQQ